MITLTRPTARKPRPARKSLPVTPDRELWKTDKDRAFEAGVRWFLAVCRAA